MPKILITGAGSVQSNGVIKSLLKNPGPGEDVIGTGSDPMDLALCTAVRKYLVPYSTKPGYREALLKVLALERPDMIHFQHDVELYEAMKFRAEIEALGIRLYAPDNEVIDTCVHKYKSWLKFKAAGIRVPENILIDGEADLKRAFADLKGAEDKIWLRSVSIGAGGKGSFPAGSYEAAREWIERNGGWGDFAAAQMLTPDSITWLSIWHEGELVVAQTRKRNGWAHASRSISGVTGVTKVGEICSSPHIDEIAL
ncbi:MAG TPA: carboxylate--amine ligase, partial [Thermoanaerobaculia bacterium]|nr:carboxylate--amine ligase [Thermoanaerobaculia bacterium]